MSVHNGVLQVQANACLRLSLKKTTKHTILFRACAQKQMQKVLFIHFYYWVQGSLLASNFFSQSWPSMYHCVGNSILTHILLHFTDAITEVFPKGDIFLKSLALAHSTLKMAVTPANHVHATIKVTCIKSQNRKLFKSTCSHTHTHTHTL